MSKIKGYKKVRIGLENALKKKIPQNAERAAHVAGSIIGGYASLMTPVDTSNLINSQYRTVKKEGKRVVAAIGYTAKYAAAVHNAPGTLKGKPRAHFGKTSNRSEFGPVIPRAFGGGTGRGNYWDPDAEPRFLEKAATENMDEINEAVMKAMKL